MRKLLVTILAIVVIVLVAIGFAQWNAGNLPGSGGPGDNRPPEAAPPGPPTETEPDWCPAVEFIAIPGTWESSRDDDPFNPQANPASYMLSITKPLQEAYDVGEVRVWTTPYTAQFRNIQSEQARKEMSYDESRAEGTARTNGELEYVNSTCPSTKFMIAGFSQGAVIAGNITNLIGTRRHAVPPEKLLGAVMIADGRRENGVGVNPGRPSPGVGAEIALKPLQGVVNVATPGATMLGPRDGGFGEVSDRAFEICAENDSVCDAPEDFGTLVARAGDLLLANGIHAMYASNPEVIDGTTASKWTVNWARGVIDALPR